MKTNLERQMRFLQIYAAIATLVGAAFVGTPRLEFLDESGQVVYRLPTSAVK